MCFSDEAIYRSIHAENAYPVHDSLADAGPSQIDLWELAEADDQQDIEGWRAPFDGVSVTSPEVKLSKRIQAEIKQLVARRHHDRQRRQPPPPYLWRRAGAGTPARQPVRRRDPGAEARQHSRWPAPTG